jgi:hypothetical protein
MPSVGNLLGSMRTVDSASEGKSMSSTSRASMGSASWAVQVISLLILIFCVVVCGCKRSQTIWSAEARSPDGKMVATAHAFANGGFGISGAPATFVYLNWTTGSQKPTEILCLGDESDKPDESAVGMNWLTPAHLELTYKGSRQTVSFQAIKFAGIDISVRDVSSDTTSVPR